MSYSSNQFLLNVLSSQFAMCAHVRFYVYLLHLSYMTHKFTCALRQLEALASQHPHREHTTGACCLKRIFTLVPIFPFRTCHDALLTRQTVRIESTITLTMPPIIHVYMHNTTVYWYKRRAYEMYSPVVDINRKFYF